MFVSRNVESGGPKLAVLVFYCNIQYVLLQTYTLIKKTDGASKQNTKSNIGGVGPDGILLSRSWHGVRIAL